MAWRRGQTYSQDLRDRVLAAAALTARQAAERFGVSVSYVVKARQRLVRTGAPTPRPQKPPIARKLLPFHGALQERVARVPDASKRLSARSPFTPPAPKRQTSRPFVGSAGCRQPAGA